MVSTCFYFQVHQPHRLRDYKVFDISKNHNYFDDKVNEEICNKVANKCYLPTNKLMLKLINKHSKEKNINDKETGENKEFKIAYSISGTAIDQFEQFTPKVIESFKQLAETGNVEFLNETYYHSLSFLKSKKEFHRQIKMHKKKMNELFKVKPKVFRNTELIFNNELATFIENQGFKGILAEGADHILGNRSPNFVYNAKTTNNSAEKSKIKLLLKNYKLSDDIAFRFSNQKWKEWPLTTPKFTKWLNQANGNGDVVNLFMDYETFGEHQWEHTGIFKFMEHLPEQVLKHPHNQFVTPSEAIKKHKAREEIDMHNFVSWADVERDLSAWLGNHMQNSAFDNLHKMETQILRTKDKKLIEDWRKLQTSDHFYYMCTKWFSDGDVHKYFNPYDSPYDGFISFMNIINDLRYRVKN
mgnify:CR=1 FL=1|jgi:alpha-amylase